jgi:hypothetical protein
MKNTINQTTSAVDMTKLDKVMKDVNLSNIPTEIGSGKEGAHAGHLVEYLPSWAKKDGAKRAFVHNRYKTIESRNSMGLIETKTVFDGFYLYTSLGKDRFNRTVIDTLCFYDSDFPEMTFEKAIKNIADSAKAGVSPDGPARKLQALAIENGISDGNPTKLFNLVDEQTGELRKLNYAQKVINCSSTEGNYKYKRRICMSLAYFESTEKSRSTQQPNKQYANRKQRYVSNSNMTANHRRDAFNNSWNY